MKIVWSLRALERLAEIGDYIAHDRPVAAADWVEEIFGSVKRLSRFPKSGRGVPESARSDLREVIHGSYRVIYRVDSDRVVVLTVRHARQELLPDDPDLR